MSLVHGRFGRLAAAVAASLVFTSVGLAQGPGTPPHKGLGLKMMGDESGVSVAEIAPGSPAEKAGIKVGDKVVSIAGVSIMEFDPEKMRSVADTAKSIPVVVMRGNQKMTFDVVPVAMNVPPSTKVERPGP